MGALTDSYNKWRGQQGENSAAGSNTSTGDEEKKVTVIGKVEETKEDSGPKNVGGFGGGLEYLGTKFVDGLVSNVEGIVDFVAGGIAEIRGNDEKAQEIFQNDWYNYNRADEKYNPGTGMKVAGDLTGVVGGAIPDIGVGIGLAALHAPAVVAALIGAGLSFTSGSGRGINEAVNKTGELGNKEWAGGMGSGALAAGIELISGGIGAATGGMFGKATTEIGMEIGESFSKKASSKAIGGALGEIAEEGSEATAKNIIKKIFTSKTGKELAGEMISEGIEESVETFIEPVIKQNTYDPDAPNAGVGDVGYSFLLGAVSGGIIKGGQLGINSAVNTVRGGKISADSTKMNNLMHNAQAVSSYESEKQTGSEVFQAVTNLYNEVQQKLQASGGKPTMATMEKIGELDRMVTTAVLVPSMVNAAKGIAQNAQSTVDALNNFYKKTGQDSITVEQLTAGLVTDKGGKAFVRSVEKAMSTNGLLRSVVINNMLGRMEFDAQSFANSIYGDIDISSIATQQNLNRFLSTADAATINQLGAALGISNWAAVTPEELAARIEAFRDSGRAELHRGGYEAIEKAKRAKGYTNGMPTSVSALRQGATRFKTDKADFAIIREGDKFRLYDFETGHVTNAMSLADMEAIVARLKQRTAEIDAESEMQALDRELNDFANENVPEYKKLTEAEKEAVRATLRSARANGISVKDQILFARIAAKSGLNIIVEPNLKGNNPARYDGKNTVYINASAPRTRLYSGLLGHEVFHKMFRSSKIKRLFMQAWNNIDEGKRQSVINRYMSELEEYDTTLGERIDIANEEVAAAYAEELFNNPGVWDYILSEEPSLKDRVIAFFKGAPKRYSFAPEMDAAAKKWIQEYKKLFDQVAARNAGMNVVEDVTTVERKEQIKRIGKLVDEMGGTATQVPNKVIKRLGKIVPENEKTASGTKVQDSGERFAFAGENAKTADKLKLSTAKKMIEDGIDSETVRKETGWFRGYDGKWRFEIDDSNMDIAFNGKYSRDPDVKRYAELVEKVYFLATATEAEQSELATLDKKLKNRKIEPVKLGDMINHPTLFEAYPQLSDVNIRFEEGLGNTNGVWNAQFNEIVLSKSLKMNKKKAAETLIHEIQHAIQYYESFAYGASPEYWVDNPIFAEEGNEKLHAAQKKLDAVYAKFRKIWKDDINWNLAKEYKRLQELWWESSDAYYIEEKMADIEAAAKEAGFDDLLDEYLMADAEYEIAKRSAKRIPSYELYQRTAGEVEARDAASRANFTAEERKNTRPDIDRKDVVFAESSSISYFAKDEYDAETAGIKDQIRNSQSVLNKMGVVYSGTVPTHFENRLQSKKWAVEELSKRGFKADRQGFGVIEFSEKDIYGAIDHLDTDEERAAIAAVYHVLKRGIQIGEHGNHKLRQKHTVTFAAPVEINGVRGNMAVVVNMRNKKYYVHRIIMPDGSSFKFTKNKNANQEAQRGVPEGSLANATRSASKNIIHDSNEKINTSGKNSSKDFDSGERSALADGKSEKLTEAEQEMLDNPWVGRVEREAIVEALIKEAKTPEELDTIDSYIRESDILVEKLGERASALRDIKAEKKKISDLLSGAESKDARKKVMQSKQYKEAKRKIIMLEDKVSLIEDEISRRDAELFRLSSIKPLHDMLMRAYQIGKEEGATARVSQGLVNKRVAAVLNAKFFTLKDAQAIINDIVAKYPVDDYNVRSELARRLWTQLNATEDLKDQKQALKEIANDVVKAVYAKKSKDMKIESAVVKRAGKYKGRIAFTEEERSHLIKYYGEEAENILSIWEYKGDSKTEPKALKDVLWDVGQLKPYERFAAQENSTPALRSDAFYELVDAYEIADEKIAPLRKESTSVRNEILDSLIRGFMDGGRETYKAKYDSLNDTVKLRNRIEQHAKDFKSLIKGEFANSTRNEDHLFVNTLDQIPKIMYRGTLYDGRARNVAKGLAAWYTPDNPMLGDGTNPDETLYKQDIADMLKTLSEGDTQRRLSTDELEMLDDVLKYFHSFVEHYTKVFRNKKWVDALPIAEGFMSVARAHENRVRGWSENIFANRYVKTFGDAESIMKICDGYGNGIFTDTYNNIREGYIDAKVQEMHILQEYTEFTKKNSKYIKKIDKDTVEYRGQSVPKAAMIGYYLSLARHHLVAGAAFSGFVYDRPKGKGKQVIRGYLADVDPKTVDNEGLLRSAETERNNIKKLLSEKDLEYISMIEKIYEVCGDVKYEADMAMYGYSNVVKNGGRYYPGRRYAAGQKGAGLDVYSEMGTMDRFTNASFNKNTVKGARQALYIENPDTLLRRHVSALCLYANLSPTIDNFNRLWRLDVASNANLPTSLQTMMDQSENIWRIDGKIVGYEYLKDMITDIMGTSNKKGSKVLGWLRKNYATFALGGLIGANPKVILTQFSSLISSTSILKGSSLIKSGTIKGDDVDKYCPLAELRNNEESAVKSQGVIDEIGIIGEKATALISKTDRLVIKRLFAACQVEVASDDLPLGSERNKKAAGKLLHSIILKTQQNALVTERSESMRSGSEFIKMLSMFRADSVKNTARVIDAIGEATYIKRQLGSLDNDSKTVMNKKLKEVNKKVYKATASLLMNSAFAVIIAQAMNTLYAKEKEEDERSAWAEWLIDFGGNMLGGLPVFSQVYSSLIEGYDFEGFEYAMINDLLDAAKAVDNTIDKAWEEKATSDDIMYGTKKLIDAVGQMFGIPTRNVRNTIFGLIKRFDSSTRYRIDDAYGKKNYVSDFADAIEKGDDGLATVILELGFGDKMGSGLSDKAIGELVRLGKTGENVIPSAVSDKITVDGEEIELSGKELKAVREKYGEAVDMVNMIVESEIYSSFDDEMKADAVNKIYTLYKNLAYDSVIGSKKDEEAYILSKIVEGDILCLNELAYMQPSDKDEKGNTISGSKRGKVVAAINGLDISEEEKLLLIATHGYGLKDGDVGGMNKTRADRVLFNYIASLGLTEEEMLKLYEYAGYDVENGKASGSIASGGSSSGSSSRPTLGGSRSGSRGLGGNGRLGGLGGSTRLGSRATLGSTTRNRVKRLGKLV